MREFENERASAPWLNRKRSAAIGFGLGATLALSPFVWAENPPAAGNPPQATQTAPQTMTSPIALIQHQSPAPLVKKVSPAVVNISVSRGPMPLTRPKSLN
jgi:S1-C subfamily serine protease